MKKTSAVRPRYFPGLPGLLIGILLFLCCPAGAAGINDSSRVKILVVMSYHPDFQWHRATVKGIESVLDRAEIHYFYLDTKKHLANGKARAAEAYALYRKLRPDAVIAADDNAQSLFVVPYLKDKTTTPVVFCGVNNEATRYGYPAGNVTGILEKKHYRESISLAQLIDPTIKNIAVVYRDNPSNRKNIAQLRQERDGYTVAITDFLAIKSAPGLRRTLQALDSRADALLALNLTGITGPNGTPLEGDQAIEIIKQHWQKPTIGAASWEIRQGILCAVAKTGEEQGATAARMVTRILNGTPVRDIPITQNKNGRRIINVTTAKSLGLALKPIALLGAELVR